jgi:elongation factor P
MDGDDAVFMNQETFDQVNINKDMIIGGQYMKEGDIVEVVSDASTETILTAEMPVKTVLEITEMEPGIKGNTATNTLTKATVETGGIVMVPLFCKQGDKIVVDTRDGSYVERAK